MKEHPQALEGDTYDRVKEGEEVAFLQARASIIDDVESTMSDESRNKYDGGIGDYIHVLQPQVDKRSRSGSGGQNWQGRFAEMQHRTRNTIAVSVEAAKNEILKEIKEMKITHSGGADEDIRRRLSRIEATLICNNSKHDPKEPQKSEASIPEIQELSAKMGFSPRMVVEGKGRSTNSVTTHSSSSSESGIPSTSIPERTTRRQISMFEVEPKFTASDVAEMESSEDDHAI